MKRRPFLHRIWSALGLLLVGGWTGASLRALDRAAQEPGGAPEFPDALIDGLEPGSSVVAGDWRLRRGVGEAATDIVALSLRCTHLGCHLEPAADRPAGALLCPCHRSRFDAEGRPLEGPAGRPLERRRLKRIGDRWVAPRGQP